MGAEEQILLNKIGKAIDENELTIRAENFFTAIVHDEIPNHTYGTRVGSSSDIDTGVMLLSNNTSSANPFIFPSTEQQMKIVSTSASDSESGTGAQQVTIDYFNSPSSGWTKKRETITLNGVTAVNTVATDIYRIDRFWVNRTGGGLVTVGDISLQSLSGATTFEKIDAGTNVFRSAIHWIEKGKMSMITDFNAGVGTNQGVIVILDGSEEDANGNVVIIGKDQFDLSSGALHASYNSPIVVNNPNGKAMFFAIAVKGRQVNQQASGSFRFIDHLSP